MKINEALKEMKKIVVTFLSEVGIIKGKEFTGRIIINVSQGGITSIERTEKI